MPGFVSSISNSNEAVFALNADFSGNSDPSELNGLRTNGQLWIGSTAVNFGSTHINVGTLTSPNNTITIGYSSPNITLDLSGGGQAIDTITGDSGSVTGDNVFFKAHTSNGNAGSTVAFVTSSATEMNLQVTDSFLNTLVGAFAGNASLATVGASNHGFGYAVLHNLTTGISNTAIGYSSMTSLENGDRNVGVGHGTLSNGTSFSDNTAVGYLAIGNLATAGTQNTALGSSALSNISSGTNNIAVGYNAGVSLSSSNSSNIFIGNTGTVGDNNKIKIGTQGSGAGQQNICIIAGIASVAVSNMLSVVVNSSTGQLGTSGSLVSSWTDVTSSTQALAVGNGYITDRGAGVTYTLPATASIGDTLKFVGKLGLATITPNANQQILTGSASGAVGVTGTCVSTNVGDSLELVCITSGASTVWRAQSVIGTWTLN